MKRYRPGGFLFSEPEPTTMTNLPIAKRTKGNESRNKSNWQVRGMMRLGQLSKPGVYPLTLIVGPDGGRQLVVENGKIEDLGS